MSFVDLPGYGFAKVARSVKENWGEMIEAYLRQRTNLALVVLILDIRRVPNEDDLSLRDWLDHYRIPYLYVLTKSDKLSNNQSVKQKQIIEKILNVSKEEKLILFSAKTQKGKDDLWKILGKYSNNPKDVICQ
ncbi:MAG: putative GTP-binding protein EngB [Deltaproteobacteria bacterium ADurb.BinA014]|nr:MAG: putative GTP-binding protein EngB [Deltaproteobacteria bacterium ADurb.BinA014]